MKKSYFIIFLLILFSCDKDNEPKINDMSLLQGKWSVTSQTWATVPSEGYSQIHILKTDTSDATRVDTIQFGSTTFRFSAYNDNNFYNTFSLASQNVRELFALYSVSGTLKDSLRIRSVVNAYMLQDTIVDGFRTPFYNMAQLDYKIESLSVSKLQLSRGDEKLELEKIE